MQLIRNLVLATALALFSGFASAHYAIDYLGKGSNLRTGQWTRLESIENTAGNPYRAALKVRTSGVALAPGEGLIFTSDRDESGARFKAGCDYRLAGPMPKATLWSLSVNPENGQATTAFADRRYLVSRTVQWESDGRLSVAIASDARAGNWLAAPPAEGFTVSLRLYDTPLALNTTEMKIEDLPTIEKGACAS